MKRKEKEEKKAIEKGHTFEEELELAVRRFVRGSESLLEMCKSLGIEEYEDVDRPRWLNSDEAISSILEELRSSEEPLKRLKESLNSLSDTSTRRSDHFLGAHLVVIYDDEFAVEEGPDEERWERVKEEVKEIAKGNERMIAFLRGMILGGRNFSDRISTEWSKAKAAGSRFYQGEGTFYPTNQTEEPAQITGISTRNPNSGRKYSVDRELAPVIWEALDELREEEKGPVSAPEMEVPEEIGRRKPKFEEVLDSVEVTEEDVENFEKILEENDALDHWSDYVAPGVRFRDEAKRAVLCMLASPEDKHRNKGRINAIMYGPPGTGKTAFKNFLGEKLGAYSIDGSRVSKADLTYNKSTDEDGLLVRAHKGVAVIEEADKMDTDAMGAALTALGETGRIEIRNMVLPAEVRGIMLGNYRSKEEIVEKHGEALFNRFEFILEFRELDEEELDETLDWHYRFFRKPKPKADASWLRKYLKWVRDFEPDLSEEELERINEFKSEKLDRVKNVREGISIMTVAYTIARLNHRDVRLRDYKKAYDMVTRGR